MRYRRLGGAGIKGSEVALGGWLTYGDAVSERTARKCVQRAWDLGINFFDTADAYAAGKAEEALGRCLSDLPRHDLVVASKCYFPMSEGPNDRGLSRKHIIEACEASLTRLRLDHLDLYQAHRYDDEVDLEEVVLAMDHLVRQGKILYWGTSNWSALQLNESVELARTRGAYSQISDQPRYNLLDRSLELDKLEVARRQRLGFVVYSPLAQGVLTGKYSGGGAPAGTRAADSRANRWMGDWLRDECTERAEKVAGLARELGRTPAQLALAWCLRWPEVSSVIIGASRPEQIDENAAASGFDLDEATIARLEEICPMG